MLSSAASATVTARCKGLLFDMDGILISSLGSVERSWTRWAEMRGIAPEQALAIAHGRRAIETVAELRPDLHAGAELKLIEDIELADTGDIQVLPGVHKLLTGLPKDRWTVVTSATERLARVRLTAAGIPVPERLVTAESVNEGKPNPAPFLAGAALLGLTAGECIVFEDSSSGAMAGRAAGCIVIATIFSHSAASLNAAHYLIEDLTHVHVIDERDGLTLQFAPLAS